MKNPTTSANAKLKIAIDKAAARDKKLRAVINRVGYPSARGRPPGFETLLKVIVSQQLSVAAADGIWRRLKKICGGAITARKILNRNARQLQNCGLSRQKVSYCTGLAKMVTAKEINLAMSPATHTADEVIHELIKVRGIGVWSAEIYAMFALDFADVFPSGDLALQVAVQRYANLPARPDAKTTAALAEKWSPHRSSVALLMWLYYRDAAE